MGAKPTVNLSTWFDRYITKVKANAQKSAVEAANIIGEQIVHDAREQLIADGHVKTGALLDSIHYSVEEYEGGEGMGVVIHVTADAKNKNGQEYGVVVEATDPFMLPAVYDNIGEIPAEFHAVFQDYMKNG